MIMTSKDKGFKCTNKNKVGPGPRQYHLPDLMQRGIWDLFQRGGVLDHNIKNDWHPICINIHSS